MNATEIPNKIKENMRRTKNGFITLLSSGVTVKAIKLSRGIMNKSSVVTIMNFVSLGGLLFACITPSLFLPNTNIFN